MAEQNRLHLLDDIYLVAAAQLGSPEAYDALARRYRGAVLHVARSYVCSEDIAEDVAQDALLTALASLNHLRQPERFASWLYTITRRRAMRTARNRRQEVPMEYFQSSGAEQARLQADVDNPLHLLLEQEQRSQIETHLLELPEAQRTVLFLYYYEDWSVEQIGNFLSLPATTVKWRLHSGRKLLSRKLIHLFEEIKNVRHQ